MYFSPSCMLYTVLLTIPAQRQTEQPDWRQPVLVFNYSFLLTNTSDDARGLVLSPYDRKYHEHLGSGLVLPLYLSGIQQALWYVILPKREHKEAHAAIALAPLIIDQSAGQQSQTANWGWSALSSRFHRLDCHWLSLGECGTHFHHTP